MKGMVGVGLFASKLHERGIKGRDDRSGSDSEEETPRPRRDRTSAPPKSTARKHDKRAGRGEPSNGIPQRVSSLEQANSALEEAFSKIIDSQVHHQKTIDSLSTAVGLVRWQP